MKIILLEKEKTVPADLLIIPFACYPPLSHDPVPAERYRAPDPDPAEILDPIDLIPAEKNLQTPDPVSLRKLPAFRDPRPV